MNFTTYLNPCWKSQDVRSVLLELCEISTAGMLIAGGFAYGKCLLVRFSRGHPSICMASTEITSEMLDLTH